MSKKEKSSGAGANNADITLDQVIGNGQMFYLKQPGWWDSYSLIIELQNNYVTVGDLGKLKKIAEKDELIKTFSKNNGLQKLLKEISEKNDGRVVEAALRTTWLEIYEPFDKSSTDVLLYMIEHSYIPIIEYLINSHSDKIIWNYFDIKSNQTLLSLACNKQLLSVIEILISYGTSILVQNHSYPDFWILPTYTNIEFGVIEDKDIVVYSEFMKGMSVYSLITNPGKANLLKLKVKYTPFNKVGLQKKQELLLQILRFPSPSLILFAFDKYLKEFTNLLLLAVEYAHPIVLSTLLNHKHPSLSQTQREHTTQNNILHKAILLRNYDILEMLMKESQTANLNAKNQAGKTPIDLAIQVQHFEAITIIFDNNYDLMDKQWLNLVEIAITNSNIELLRVLMNYFNDEYSKGKLMYEKISYQGLFVLHIAVQKYSEETFEIILEKYRTQSLSKRLNLIDCRITSQSNDLKGFTPLLLSLKLKQYFATVKLLEAGASSLNEGDLCYFHLLIQSCKNKEELNTLLSIELNSSQFSHSNTSHKNKVRIWEVTDSECNTLLHYSIKCCNSVAIELLRSITPFPDLFKPDSKGNSLLHTAATLSQDPVVMDCLVETLKTHQTNTRYCELLNLQNKNDGYTALMSAVISNHSGAVISLIKEGASILLLNHKGDSILHIAAKEGKEEIFKLILDFIDHCKIDKASHLNILHQPNSEGCSPIQCAIINGQVGIVKIFHEKHDISMCDDKTGYSLLHLAVLLKSIDLQVRKNLIAELLTEKSLLETRDRDGRTPLMLSTINHMVDSISLLLPYQPDLLTIDAQGLSLLHNAVISYDKRTFANILKAISLSKNAQEILNFVDKQEMTVLHYSILKNNKEATEEILKQGLSLEAQNIEGNTYLHIAAKSPNTVNILKLIIRHSKMRNNFLSLLKKQNNKYLTPLLHAICFQNYEACKILISEKANLFYQTVNGPAFHQTINKLILTICEYQTDYYIGYCFPCNGNNTCWILTPLASMETAIHVSNITIKVFKDLNDNIVQKIVSCPLAQPLQTILQQVNFSKYSPQLKKSSLYMPAAHHGSLPVIRFLLKEHLKLNDLENIDHGSILCESISNSNIDILKELCKAIQQQDKLGHIISRKQGSGIYLLELCVLLDKVEAFEYLMLLPNPEFLQHGALINHLYEHNVTLLHMIIRKSRPASFLTSLLEKNRELQSSKSEKQLIEGVSIIDHQDVEGKTALLLCIETGNFELLEKLLQYHPDLALYDACGNNIIHYLAKFGSDSIVNIILKSPPENAFPKTFYNEANTDGCTPLHLAAGSGNESLFCTLLNKGADMYAIDHLGQTVLHHSLEIKEKDERLTMIDLILKHHSRTNINFVQHQNVDSLSALQISVRLQYENEVDLLLQVDPDTMYLEDNNTSQNSLHLAVSSGNINFLGKILSYSDKKTNATVGPSSSDYSFVCDQDKYGKTPVHLSIENENLDALEMLLPLSKHCLEIVDNFHDTLLHYAVRVSGGSCVYLEIVLQEFKSLYIEDFQTRLYPCNSKGFPPLQYAIELNKLQAAIVLFKNSVQLPYCEQRKKLLLRSPQSKLSLHIYIEKMKPSNDPHRECWIGFQINTSNWIVATLPELSKTEHFDQTNSLLEVSKLNEHQLIAILQCHSTDPFKSAIDSKLITQQLRFDDGSTLLKYVGQFSTKQVIAYFIVWCKCVIFDSTKGESSLIEYTVANSDPLVLRFLFEKLNPIINQSLTPPQPYCTEEVRNQDKVSLCLKNALKLSLNNDTIHVLEVLFQFNAGYYHTYDQQNTLLHLMVIQQKPCDFIESLLNRTCGIEKESTDPVTIRFIDALNARKETALHLALQMGQENTVKTILKFHPEIISKDSNGNPPLHLSILLNNYEIIETILNLSQQNLEIINAVNKQNCTSLHLSVDNGDYNVTKLLLRSKADIYCQDDEKKTILHHAIQITDCDSRSLMLSKLIKFEGETFSSNKLCTAQDVNGNTPLSLAIAKSDHVIVKRLLVFPSVLKVTNELQQTPLHLEVINKNELTTDSILVAIKKTENISEENIPGKDSIINSQDSTGCTPLHLSIQHRNTDALAKLLAVKPSLGIFNNDGDQALHLAVLSKENAILDEVLDSILRQEAESINLLEQRLTCVRQRDGKTPLHLSIESRNTHALQALLCAEPCLDVCDLDGNTILHYAVNNSFDDSTCLEIILKELRERYSDDYSYFVYFLNSRKLTPLHFSIKLSNIDCIKKLLENQVNLAFLKPCGDMTLLDGIEGFKLLFVKRKDEYWVGYKFTKSNKTYWIVTNLPNLDHTEFVEGDLPAVMLPAFKLLEVISRSKSTEPLDAALTNKLLNLNTSLKHEQKDVHMSQVIARHGSKQSLRCLLDKTKFGLFHRSDKKESMIECAVSNPNIDALEFLLHSLPPFQETDAVGNEPHSSNAQIHLCLKNSFQLSISNSSPCALISLLHFYPKIDCTYMNDNTLIHLMVIDNKPSQFLHQVYHEIEKSNASYANLQIINHSNFDKKTTLHYCVEQKQLELLCILLKFNPDVFVVDENGETPLHYAVNSNVLESVQTLYRYAPCLQQLSSQNKDANAALHLAVKNQNVEIVRYLLECEPPLHLQNDSGSTVLHLAVGIVDATQRKLILDALLEHNANKGLNVTCIQDSQLKSPLHLAVTLQNLDIVHSLLAADPKALGIQDNKKQTPFHLTIIPSFSEGQVVIKDDKVFDSLLKVIEQQGKHEYKGYCDGNHLICIQDERKRTAMHYAIEHHYLHAFTELLKTGSCLDLPDEDGNTLAHEAVKKNRDVKFLKILVKELKGRYPQ